MEDKIIAFILYEGYEMISNRLHKKNTDLFYWLFFIMDLDNIKKPKQKTDIVLFQNVLYT